MSQRASWAANVSSVSCVASRLNTDASIIGRASLSCIFPYCSSHWKPETNINSLTHVLRDFCSHISVYKPSLVSAGEAHPPSLAKEERLAVSVISVFIACFCGRCSRFDLMAVEMQVS